MSNIRIVLLSISLVFLSLLLTACGGVGDSTLPTSSSNPTIEDTSNGTVPQAPDHVLAEGSDGQIRVTWGSVPGATSYRLYLAEQSGVTSTNYLSLTGGREVGNATSPQTITGLTNGAGYYIVVTALNAVGESVESTEVTVTPISIGTVPQAPDHVLAEGSDGQVIVTWGAVTGATSYRLYLAEQSGVTSTNYQSLTGGREVANATSPQTISGLTNGASYYIVVTALNAVGESVESTAVMVTPQLTSSSKLNDTGITWGGNYPSGNNSSCIGETIAEQDCSKGRDAQAVAGTLSKVGGGQAGFDFTKLDASGNALAAGATSWSCVRDNHTGLVWEVKTTDGGIHDASKGYRWGGKTARLTAAFGTQYSDWDTLVDGSNAGSGLCGFSDWRVPDREELRSIVNYNQSNPAIDTTYFPNTGSIYYWSASPNASSSLKAWGVYFYYGNGYHNNRNYTGRVRLVRGGQ